MTEDGLSLALAKHHLDEAQRNLMKCDLFGYLNDAEESLLDAIESVDRELARRGRS